MGPPQDGDLPGEPRTPKLRIEITCYGPGCGHKNVLWDEYPSRSNMPICTNPNTDVPEHRLVDSPPRRSIEGGGGSRRSGRPHRS